jgi:hypothetical protein
MLLNDEEMCACPWALTFTFLFLAATVLFAMLPSVI